LGIDLRDALRSLSPKHREILELLLDEDLSQAQVSERLGIPLGTVKTRTYYGLKALKLELEERGLIG
jgi:RNA polymerase sigma-70 factor (ECF subfamily)